MSASGVGLAAGVGGISGTKTDTEQGEWLRQHGLHSEHLALYEQELEGIASDKQLD